MTENERPTLDDLKAMTCATISNALAARVLGIDPARLSGYAIDGQLGWNTIRSGNRVKHSREDFIRFWGGYGKHEKIR